MWLDSSIPRGGSLRCLEGTVISWFTLMWGAYTNYPTDGCRRAGAREYCLGWRNVFGLRRLPTGLSLLELSSNLLLFHTAHALCSGSFAICVRRGFFSLSHLPTTILQKSSAPASFFLLFSFVLQSCLPLNHTISRTRVTFNTNNNTFGQMIGTKLYIATR